MKAGKITGLDLRERRNSFLAVVPALIIFVMFKYYPLFVSILYSLTDWDGFSPSYNFVGFENFKYAFKSLQVYKAFANTFYFSIVSVVLGTIMQLFFAVLLNKKFKGAGIYKTLVYIPVVISFMILSLTWRYILQYDGVLNKLLSMAGLDGLRRDWLGDPKYALNVVVMINLLQSCGTGIVLFLAGLNNVSPEIYEAAGIDGAHGFGLFRRITLPLIMPSVTITLFIGITGSLQVFELPFILTNGGPLESTQTVMMLIYKTAFYEERFGRSSAMGMIFFVIIAVISVAQTMYSRSKEVQC